AKKAATAAVKAQLSGHWRAQFALPENGPAGLEETAYYLDFQGTRIVSLNSNERREEQVGWLEGVLGKNPNRWTVVTFHHPIYSSAKDRDNKELRDLWQPTFDKYKVDIVLQGHDHTYARSGLRVYDNVGTGISTRDAEGGTVYVVSVSGPKMYNLDKSDWMRRAAEDTQLYQTIRIDGDRLSFEAKTATGELYDAFDLVKREGRPNELVEKAPKTPEYRRPAPPQAAPKAEALR
ncbi:metallophosphoesterase family protein, partial [Singulisphaera rosea]